MHEADNPKYLVALVVVPVSHTCTQCMNYAEIFNALLDLSSIYFAAFDGR